jgi:SRSO17 transposase
LEDRTRRVAGKIPEAIVYQSKNELALSLLDQVLSWDLPRLPVVADSAYGNEFGFRQALREMGLCYAVAVESTTKVWTDDPNQIPVPASKPTGRPRRFVPLASLPPPLDLLALARSLPSQAWKRVTWRHGSHGPQRSRFAKVQVWAAHGWRKQQHPDRVAEWLLIEWPEGKERPTDYWLADFGPKALGLRRLVRTARSRWRVELDYRELKEELGLDHYEGRHWMGWNHHVTLVSLAFAFLRQEQVHAKKNFWCDIAADAPRPADRAD